MVWDLGKELVLEDWDKFPEDMQIEILKAIFQLGGRYKDSPSGIENNLLRNMQNYRELETNL